MSIKLFILLSPQTCSWPLSYSALVPALRVPLYSLGAAKTLSSRGAIPGRSRLSSALAAGQRWPPWTPGHTHTHTLIKLVKLEFKPKAGAQSLPRVHCWCLSGYWERPRIITMLINQIKDVFSC